MFRKFLMLNFLKPLVGQTPEDLQGVGFTHAEDLQGVGLRG